MMPIIYITTNLINGRKYLGKYVHKKPFYFGSGIALKLAIQKYGREYFRKTIIMEIPTIQDAAIHEKRLSILWNVKNNPIWYNMIDGGIGGSVKGRIASDETKRRISENKKGKYLGRVVKGMLGKKQTEEWKKIISSIQKGHPKYGKSKPAQFIDPIGREYIVDNISEFCRNHKLRPNTVIGFLNSTRKTMQSGWKAKYL